MKQSGDQVSAVDVTKRGQSMTPDELMPMTSVGLQVWAENVELLDRERLLAYADAWKKTLFVAAQRSIDDASTIDSLQARIEELDSNAGLLASLLREAWLFKGYSDGPLAHNHEAIRMVLNTRATLAEKE